MRGPDLPATLDRVHSASSLPRWRPGLGSPRVPFLSPATLDPPYPAFFSRPLECGCPALSPPVLGFSFTFLKLLSFLCPTSPFPAPQPRPSFEFASGPSGPDGSVPPHLAFPEALQLLGHSSQVAGARKKSTLYHVTELSLGRSYGEYRLQIKARMGRTCYSTDWLLQSWKVAGNRNLAWEASLRSST